MASCNVIEYFDDDANQDNINKNNDNVKPKLNVDNIKELKSIYYRNNRLEVLMKAKIRYADKKLKNHTKTTRNLKDFGIYIIENNSNDDNTIILV